LSNDFFTDEQLKEKFGMRPTDGIPLFSPIELGWICLIDEHHETTWSEYQSHLWCYDCQKDYFTLLCPKIVNPYASEKVVAEEMASLKPLMDQWTLEKYKNS
jgi:hypothetical protein